MSRVMAQSLHEEAVAHAVLAARSGDLMWRHIESEYSQDPLQIAETLDTEFPLAWALAQDTGEEGSYHFLVGTTVEAIRQQYEVLRTYIEIWGWKPLLEIRQSWYTLTQGVALIKSVATGELHQNETVNLFPNGEDGVLGELQCANVGRLPNGRYPADDTPLPLQRLAALEAHDSYIEALRTEDVDRIVAAHSPKGCVAMRSYVTDESTQLNVTGLDPLREYFSALFRRYHVRDLRLVNRVAEAWYVFAELHWTVEERGGEQRTLEFCTAELSPLDYEGRYWIRTGAGTDPLEV